MPTTANQVATLIDQRQDELVAILNELVAFPTVAPPARNTAPLQEWLATQLAAAGFSPHLQPFYGQDRLLSATRPGSDPAHHHSLLINGHVDVAALQNREDWQSDPFQLQVAGDRLTGRGVSDMKGAMAVYLYLFRLLHELGVTLPGDLKFQAAVGEELGEAGTRTLLDQGERADFALVGDTSHCHLQGQGGVVTGWITLKSPHTYHDGNRAAMVHTGGGLKAASMVEKMPVVINALTTLERYWGITKHYPGFAPGSDTINPAYIEGGIHPAFVADECRLWITVHFYPNETVAGVTAEVEEAVRAATAADPWLRETPPTFDWGGRSMLEDKGEVFPALPLDLDHPAVQLLAQEHQAVWGQAAVTEMSPSVTDGGWFAAAGIPAVIYGPGQLTQAHSDNEEASLSELLAYAKVVSRFILDWCQSTK